MGGKLLTKTKTDILVIGSGAGGSIAANILAEDGHKVTIIEEAKLGGSCLNYSCLPTKALLQTSYASNIINRSYQFGLESKAVKVNFDNVKRWAQRTIANTH